MISIAPIIGAATETVEVVSSGIWVERIFFIATLMVVTILWIDDRIKMKEIEKDYEDLIDHEFGTYEKDDLEKYHSIGIPVKMFPDDDDDDDDDGNVIKGETIYG